MNQTADGSQGSDTETRFRNEQNTAVLALATAMASLERKVEDEAKQTRDEAKQTRTLLIAVLIVVVIFNPMVKDVLTLLLKFLSV